MKDQKPFYITFLLALTVLGSGQLVYATPWLPETLDESAFINPGLVDKFYQSRNNSLFWFAGPAERRKELVSIVDKAALYGLDKARYHAAEMVTGRLSGSSDRNMIRHLDRLYTDAFISFCKDLYAGRDIYSQLSFDELSLKYKDHDNEYILTQIESIKDAEDIYTIIKNLEPSDSFYRALKFELIRQLQVNNTGKVRQLNSTIDLYRWIHHFRFTDYIVINTCLASFGYFEHDSVILSSNVIVGKLSTKTPRFAAYCDKVILYPYWNVPRTIAVKELLPKIKRSPAVLDAMNIQVIGRNGRIVDHNSVRWSQYNRTNFPYTLRQCTGCDNSLGVIKFNLTDPFDVYLHDTNAKGLFRSKSRYYSHGCIRLEKAVELGNILLKNKLDDSYLTKCLKDQKPVEHKLDEKIPVFVIYSTVGTDSLGKIEYNKDVYHLMK